MVWGFGSKEKKVDKTKTVAELIKSIKNVIKKLKIKNDIKCALTNDTCSDNDMPKNIKDNVTIFWAIIQNYFTHPDDKTNEFYKYKEMRFYENHVKILNHDIKENDLINQSIEKCALLVYAFYTCYIKIGCKKKYNTFESDSDSDDGDSDSDDNGSKVVNQENIKLPLRQNDLSSDELKQKREQLKNLSMKLAKQKANEITYNPNNVQQQIANIYKKQNPTKTPVNNTVKPPKAPVPKLDKKNNSSKNDQNNGKKVKPGTDKKNNFTDIMKQNPLQGGQNKQKKGKPGKGDPSEKYRTKDVGTKRGRKLYDSVSLRF